VVHRTPIRGLLVRQAAAFFFTVVGLGLFFAPRFLNIFDFLTSQIKPSSGSLIPSDQGTTFANN
jgi:hypothetical protein